jgi:uncharacterized surface protein with fasciclin (FAS1) repeats
MTKITRTLIGGLAAFSLVAAGCSDDSDSDTTTPAATDAPVATDAPTTDAPAEPGTIVDVATEAGAFTTLLAAVEAAGLVETLQGDGPFTVFAPTDDAFAAVPADVLEKLLLPENVEVLKSILLYHVVSGAAVTSDQVAAGPVEMANGDSAEITVDGGVKIDGANVVTVDVTASNGVIHVIDAVIIPASVDLSTL